jgi:outer membrane protein assembly factor BamE (lipoprotein component of BamABCDE complex)
MVAPPRAPSRISGMRWSTASLLVLALTSLCAVPGASQQTSGDGLAIFKAWLDRMYPGYVCDRGPAPFRNQTVHAAYPGQRFYYVLAYTRGMRPRLRNELSLVAHLDDNGTVTPLRLSSPATYRLGLRKVTTAKDARQAGAAVLILAMGDPGEGLGLRTLQDSLFTAKKGKNGWVCTYGRRAGPSMGQVTFDKNGLVSTISLNLPPVP